MRYFKFLKLYCNIRHGGIADDCFIAYGKYPLIYINGAVTTERKYLRINLWLLIFEKQWDSHI